MKATIEKTLYSLLAMLLLFVMAVSTCFVPIITYANGGVTYSSVIDDLKKDKSFNESFYPFISSDYSLQVIQLAESVDNELFVYVYQPSGQTKKLIASSINISITINDEISYLNYKLQSLNSSGVFFKYLVKDFTVLAEPTRFYAISSIYRPFDETIDKDVGHDNTVTEVNFAVSKQYCFSTINGKPFCNVVDIETVVITDKFVGFVRYMDGFQFYLGACDSHFVAFNTDKPIDKLLEADVYYSKQDYSKAYVPFGGDKEQFGAKTDNYAYLKYTDKVEHTGDGLLAGTYKWDRIETVEKFISENDLTQNVYSGAIIDINIANKITDEGKAALNCKKWVLRFTETSYSVISGSGMTSRFSTLVGDVTILRLKFETDGITYNLGVIDNKQTGSDKPSNDENIEVDPNKNLSLLWGILILLLILYLFAPIILSIIIQAVLWLAMLPFRLIGATVKGIKKINRKDKK